MAVGQKIRAITKQHVKSVQTSFETHLNLWHSQLWGCVRNVNTQVIQCFQNKVLWIMINIPWYVHKNDLHQDLKVTTVAENFFLSSKSHKNSWNIMITRRHLGCSIIINYTDDLRGSSLLSLHLLQSTGITNRLTLTKL